MQRGDILLVKYKSGIFSKLIRIITKSEWNHCAWAINDYQLIESLFQGVVISDISKFMNSAKYDLKLVRVKNINIKSLNLAVCEAEKQVGKNYDILQLISLAILFLLRYRKIQPIDLKDAYICSELIATKLRNFGFQFHDKFDADSISPADIERSDRVIDVSDEII